MAAEVLQGRIRTLATSNPAAFADAAASGEVAALSRELSDRLADLVAKRCERCLALLTAATATDAVSRWKEAPHRPRTRAIRRFAASAVQ